MENEDNNQDNKRLSPVKNNGSSQNILKIREMFFYTNANIHLTSSGGPSASDLKNIIYTNVQLRSAIINEYLDNPLIKLLYFSTKINLNDLKKQVKQIAVNTQQSIYEAIINNINEVVGFKNILISIFEYLEPYSRSIHNALRQINNEIDKNKLDCRAIVEKINQIIADKEKSYENKIASILDFLSNNFPNSHTIKDAISSVKREIQNQATNESIVSSIEKLVKSIAIDNNNHNNATPKISELLREMTTTIVIPTQSQELKKTIASRLSYSFATISEAINLLIDLGIEPLEILYDAHSLEFVSTDKLNKLIAIVLKTSHNSFSKLKESGDSEAEIYYKILTSQQSELIESLPKEQVDFKTFLQVLEVAVKFGREEVVKHLFGDFDFFKNKALEINSYDDFYYAFLSSFVQAIMRGNENICLQFIKPEIWQNYQPEEEIALVKLICLRMSTETAKILIKNLIENNLMGISTVGELLTGSSDQDHEKIQEVLKNYQKDILTNMILVILKHQNLQNGDSENAAQSVVQLNKNDFALQLTGIASITKSFSESSKLTAIREHIDALIPHIDKFREIVTTNPRSKDNDHFYKFLQNLEQEALKHKASEEMVSFSTFSQDKITTANDSKKNSPHKNKKPTSFKHPSQKHYKKVVNQAIEEDKEEQSAVHVSKFSIVISDDKTNSDVAVENSISYDDHKPDEDGSGTAKIVSTQTQHAEKIPEVRAQYLKRIAKKLQNQDSHDKPTTSKEKLERKKVLHNKLDTSKTWAEIVSKSSTDSAKIQDTSTATLSSSKTDVISDIEREFDDTSSKSNHFVEQDPALLDEASDTSKITGIGEDSDEYISDNEKSADSTSGDSQINSNGLRDSTVSLSDNNLKLQRSSVEFRFGSFTEGAHITDTTLPNNVADDSDTSSASYKTKDKEVIDQKIELESSSSSGHKQKEDSTTSASATVTSTQNTAVDFLSLQAVPISFNLEYFYYGNDNSIYSNFITCNTVWLKSTIDNSLTYYITISDSQNQLVNYYYIDPINMDCTVNSYTEYHQSLKFSELSTISHQIGPIQANTYAVTELDNFNRPLFEYTIDAYNGQLLGISFGVVYSGYSIALTNNEQQGTYYVAHNNQQQSSTSNNNKPKENKGKSNSGKKHSDSAKQNNLSDQTQDNKVKIADSLKDSKPKSVEFSVKIGLSLDKNITVDSDYKEYKENKEKAEKDLQERYIIKKLDDFHHKLDTDTANLLLQDASNLLNPLLGKHDLGVDNPFGNILQFA